MSDSSPPSPIMLDSIANYVELAALVVPQRKLGIKEKLRAALPFLPMPLSLGWDADDEAHHDSAVPGLLFSDIKSGATRQVTAPWMHALYKHIQSTQEPGTLLLHLHEAGYTAHFRWPHALILGTFLLQVSVVHFAMSHGQKREGWLLLAGLLIRIGEGVYMWACPKYRPPRTEDRSAEPRYSALHTGMTTNHILVLTHRFDSGYLGEYVVLEDSAAPLPREPTGWRRTFEDCTHGALGVSVWIQKGASLVTAANGYKIPVVLLLGTVVLELVSASADVLPTRAITVLKTGPSILDRLTAACQITKSISVGFVEHLLPDPEGKHHDYKWISKALEPDTPLEPHPNHPTKEAILLSTLLRRRSQNPPPVPSPAYPPVAARA